MGRRRLYCATLRARRTKRLDKRHEIARDVVSFRDCLETETYPWEEPGRANRQGVSVSCRHSWLRSRSAFISDSEHIHILQCEISPQIHVITVIKWRRSRLRKAAASSELGADFE